MGHIKNGIKSFFHRYLRSKFDGALSVYTDKNVKGPFVHRMRHPRSEEKQHLGGNFYIQTLKDVVKSWPVCNLAWTILINNDNNDNFGCTLRCFQSREEQNVKINKGFYAKWDKDKESNNQKNQRENEENGTGADQKSVWMKAENSQQQL